MAGLVPDRAPQTLRLVEPHAANDPDGEDITVEITEDGDDIPQLDERGNVLEITHGDGSVTVSMDGRPIADAQNEVGGDEGWFANLAEKIEEGERNRISEELLRGIDADEMSRKDWLEAVATGIKLLGLKTEGAGTGGSTDTSDAPVQGMSKVRHPLLLEAVLRFQANASSELLPTDGPAEDQGRQQQCSPARRRPCRGAREGPQPLPDGDGEGVLPRHRPHADQARRSAARLQEGLLLPDP